jgi:peptide/nickel transport system substrate-binding protein
MLKRYARPALLFLIVLLALPTFSFAQDSFYQQAPMLAERVAAGELPPVDERMPNNPLLVTPYESVGVYGGTWNMAMVNIEIPLLVRTIGYEGLLRWNSSWTQPVANVAQSFEISADSKTFTFKLREGLRWSDGAPFTSDDILFWYEVIYLNPELRSPLETGTPNLDDQLTVEAIDDYTVAFHFPVTNGLFLSRLAGSFF